MQVASNFAENHQKLQIWISLLFMALLIGGWFYLPLGYFMIVCMFAAMVVGIIKDRYWCDWMCPRGSS
jgi:polyferredoxin